MSDTSRQLTYPLHFLSLPCPFVCRTALSEVTCYFCKSYKFAIVPSDGIDNNSGPKFSVIFPDPPAFRLIFSVSMSNFQSPAWNAVLHILQLYRRLRNGALQSLRVCIL